MHTDDNTPTMLPLLDKEYQSAHPFKTLFGLLEVSWAKIACYWLLFLVKSSAVLFLPLYLEQMVRYAKEPSAFPSWWFWALNGGFIFLLVQNLPTHLWFVKLVHGHIRGLELRLRASLVARLQQLSIQFHRNTESGRLHTKILRDVESVAQMTSNLFHSGFSVTNMIIWGLAVTFYTDPKIGFFFIIGAPIAAFIIFMFKKRLEVHNRTYRTTVEDMSTQMSEMIDTIPVARAHAEEKQEIERAELTLKNVYTAGMTIDRTNHLFGAASFIAMQLSIVSITMVTTWLVANEVMPLERIMLYYGLFGLVVNSLIQLLGFAPIISSGFDAMRSIGEILECPDIEHNQSKHIVTEVKGAIEFEHIDFSYDEDPLLVDFNYSINPGDCVAFVGESGSGKSTLMNLAIGFYRPQKGRILLDGVDSSKLDLRTWRSHIAVVPQQTILFSGSVLDNITYGHKHISTERVWAAIDAANMREFIDEMPDGINTELGENGMSMSGGQRQRLAIARALVRNPKIIILDEATSALDVISERAVQEALDNLIKGRTVLIVAHRLSTIRKANKVVVMKDGKCVEHGSQEELMKRGGEFSKLKLMQS